MKYTVGYTLLTVTLLLVAAGLTWPQHALIGGARRAVEEAEASAAAEALYAAVAEAARTAGSYGYGGVHLTVKAMVKLEPGRLLAKSGDATRTLSPPPGVETVETGWLTGSVWVVARLEAGAVKARLEA